MTKSHLTSFLLALGVIALSSGAYAQDTKKAPAKAAPKKSALPAGTKGGTKPSRAEGKRSANASTAHPEASREPQGRRGAGRR